MKPKKRLEAINSWKEFFQLPTIIYYPALLFSMAISVLSFFVEPFSVGYLAGGMLAVILFTFLIFASVVLPTIRAGILKRDSVSGTALVIKKEKRARFIETPDNRIGVSAIVITFEFIPEGSTSPLQLEAEVARVTQSMQEGKAIKITYARSNPRIVKFSGE